MKAETEGNQVRFGRIAATVAVSNMERALEFYTGVMGMKVAFKNGDPTVFAILRRDEGELHLLLSRGHRGTTTNVCHLIVSDAGAFHARCVAGGVQIIKDLRDQEYGLRDFVIADPDGNRIDVGQPLK